MRMQTSVAGRDEAKGAGGEMSRGGRAQQSRAEQSENEKSRVQQYANEPNEENMRETPPYIGREARQISEWEMHG